MGRNAEDGRIYENSVSGCEDPADGCGYNGKKGGHEAILEAFANREADILIGTQMIVKGHDFPGVTLVGILAADLSLNTPDYRSAERTFQLLTQAAGRAGRAGKPGDVVIQTYRPEHYAVQAAAAQNYELFYSHEINYRRLLRYPPVCQMAAVYFACGDEVVLDKCAEMAARRLREKCRVYRSGSGTSIQS
ncbi:MAG: helicase-related protein [Clostridium fessum]